MSPEGFLSLALTGLESNSIKLPVRPGGGGLGLRAQLAAALKEHGVLVFCGCYNKLALIGLIQHIVWCYSSVGEKSKVNLKCDKTRWLMGCVPFWKL